MHIGDILSQIDLGAMALPEFQRGYVWNRDQVRELMTSLYKRYPVGGLLIWKTRTESAHARGDGQRSLGYVDLILDGQQRVTSLYGVICGKPPQFFQGNQDAFLNLYFNIETETFKFYSPLEMKDSPTWVHVTELMQQGIGDYRLFYVSCSRAMRALLVCGSAAAPSPFAEPLVAPFWQRKEAL